MEEEEDDEAKLMLDDLPNEVLLRILSSVEYKSRNVALLVSKRWHSLIDELIGRKLFIGRQCQLVPQDQERYIHKYVDTSAISQIGVTDCYVGEVEEPGQTMTLWTYVLTKIKTALFSGEQLPEFKYPFLLKSLHFDGPIPSLFFGSMVKDTVNLRKLEMHFSSFCVLEGHNLDLLGHQWRRLQDLCIWGHRLTDGIFTSFYNSGEVLKNVITLLSNSFKQLSEFCIEYPFDVRDDERDFTKAILSFLERHRALRKFKICINISFTEDQNQTDYDIDREWLRDSRRASRQLNLKELEIVVSSMRRVRLTKLWLAFIECQKTLESVVILSFRVPHALLHKVCESNRNCIRELFVSRVLMTHMGRHVQLSCSMFEHCNNLTRLTVEGMLSGINESGFAFTRLLPKSLIQLELGGFPISHQDIYDIFFELPNLTHICLTDVGTNHQFGVTVELLQQVIADRRIHVVTIYRSINGHYPAQGLPNGNSRREQFIRQRPYEILEFKLNADGYYENLRRTSFFDDLNDD